MYSGPDRSHPATTLEEALKTERFWQVYGWKLQTIPFRLVSGVYFLLDSRTHRKVIYVGQSENVLGRVGQHLEDKVKKFGIAKFIPVPVEGLFKVEEAFISLLKPEFNKTHVKGFEPWHMETIRRIYEGDSWAPLKHLPENIVVEDFYDPNGVGWWAGSRFTAKLPPEPEIGYGRTSKEAVGHLMLKLAARRRSE